MKNKEYFYKRFSVGLTLDATIDDFNHFLETYHRYIANFYFSLPMGDKFHSRSNVRKQLRNPETINMFWEILSIIQSYGIKLELVLNNWNVTEDDVRDAKKLLEEHDIKISLVGITNDIYDIVKRAFPSQEIVYSFNNRTNTMEEFERIPFRYDEIVVGRQNIRNSELFECIHNQMRSKVVLLLNNGCSHICGGCTTLSNCHSSYYRAKFNYRPEYLYALQSIMPFEIHNDLLDLENIDLFKINSRNASLTQLRDCIDSYINCIEDEYIKKSISYYGLWGRLEWHVEHYDEFSLERIRELKFRIYNGAPAPVYKQAVNVCLDFRDKYIFENHEDEFVNPDVSKFIPKPARSIPYTCTECIVGISNCRQLFDAVSLSKLMGLIAALRKDFNNIYMEIPSLNPQDYSKVDELLTALNNEVYRIDCLIINDWSTLEYIRSHYSYRIAIGEQLSFSKIYSVPNDCHCDNNEHFGENLISNSLKDKIAELGNIAFIVCDMHPYGLCISKNEKNKLFINVSHRNIAFNTCTIFGNSSCDSLCLNTIPQGCNHIMSSTPWKTHCNGIREIVERYDVIAKTILENRATFIMKCEE